MNRYIVFLVLLLAIEVVQSESEEDDVLKEANEAIDEVSQKAYEFEQLVKNLEAEIQKLTKKFENMTSPIMDSFEKHLERVTGYIEGKIEGKLNASLAEKTCGIIDIQRNIMEASHVVRTCNQEIISNVGSGIREITGNTTKTLKEFAEIKNKIIECKDPHRSKEFKLQCINEAKQAAVNKLSNFNNTVNLAKTNAKNIMKQGLNFKICFAVNGVSVILDRSKRFFTCIKDKLPSFQKITDKFKAFIDFFQNDFKSAVENLGSKVKQEFVKVKVKLQNVFAAFKKKLSFKKKQ